MKVTSKQEAWNKVNEIFPTDYELNMSSSDRAGALLMDVDGVVDYEGLTLSGSEENLVLEQNGVPVRGRVDLS